MSEDRDPLTGRILGCAVKVCKVLGSGFLEKIYENALMIELRKEGLTAEQQKPLQVTYDGEIVGTYLADVIVEGTVILELKAARDIDDVHEAQLLSYLKATGLKKGLLLNFGSPRLGIRRMVL